MTTGVFFRKNSKKKCELCNGTKIMFVSNLRHYSNGDRELGYYQPCNCRVKCAKIKRK